jgi:hypothetical protein
MAYSGKRAGLRRAYETYDGGLDGRVRDLRKENFSWVDIARVIELETGTVLHERTVRNWFRGQAWADAPTVWWESPAVKARREAEHEQV